jgi:hypothetical protein
MGVRCGEKEEGRGDKRKKKYIKSFTVYTVCWIVVGEFGGCDM